jgi:hypothetical protein
MIFNINQKPSEEMEVNSKEVCLFVRKISLHLKEIFEAEFDTL